MKLQTVTWLWLSLGAKSQKVQTSDEDIILCVLQWSLTCSEGWHHPSVCSHWLTAAAEGSLSPLSRPRNQEPWIHSVLAWRQKDDNTWRSAVHITLQCGTEALISTQDIYFSQLNQSHKDWKCDVAHWHTTKCMMIERKSVSVRGSSRDSVYLVKHILMFANHRPLEQRLYNTQVQDLISDRNTNPMSGLKEWRLF